MNVRRAGSARWFRGHGQALALGATLGVAALTRLVRLDLMEFKADEGEACRLALHVLGHHEPGVGSFFPTAGLVASVGVPNPPLFVYLISIPLAVARTPLAAAVFVALANVAAVGLCYVVGKRYFTPFVGLVSAALFALSPWAIVYSRKIWAQDLLPIFTVLFLLATYTFLVERRPRSVLWLIVLVGAATQIHLSAWVLGVALVVVLALGRELVERRWVALGAAGFAALYAPYVWHLVTTGKQAWQVANDHGTPSIGGRLATSARDTFAITGGDRMSLLLGSQSRLAFPLSLVLGAVALAALVAASRHRPAEPRARARVLLPLWYVLPFAALTLAPVKPYPHYFIVLYPLPFLGIAFALEQLSRRSTVLGRTAVAACLAAFAFLDVRSFQTIVDHGGARGDYGIAYRYKADAVQSLVDAHPRSRFALGTEPRFRPPTPPDYRFLVWNDRGAGAEPAADPRVGYLLIDTLDPIAPAVRRLERSHRTERFGPLEVIVVPFDRGRR